MVVKGRLVDDVAAGREGALLVEPARRAEVAACDFASDRIISICKPFPVPGLHTRDICTWTLGFGKNTASTFRIIVLLVSFCVKICVRVDTGYASSNILTGRDGRSIFCHNFFDLRVGHRKHSLELGPWKATE